MSQIINRSLSKEFLKIINEIIDYIIANDKFVVTSHINPDGDNIGSSRAMCAFLKKLGKQVVYILDDPYPSDLEFLYDKVDIDKSKSSNIKSLAGYKVIAQDSGSYERICMDKDLLETSDGIICIDHHHTNGDYGFIKYIDTRASSTCELVYNIIKTYEDRFEDIIDYDIATCLYTGLVTDTGNFQYSNTEPSSYLMAADLVTRGADKNLVIEKIFQSKSLAYYKVLGQVLDNMEIIEGKISLATVSKKMLDENNINYDDIDAITPYTRDIDGVELGIFIKEKEIGEIKVSLRSKSYVDCTKLAQVFGGGGHVRASGLTIMDKSLDEARDMLRQEAVKFI